MALPSLDEMGDLVLAYLERATQAAGLIVFNEGRKSLKARERLALLGSQRPFVELPEFYGMGAWTAYMCVDLRGSTKRAMRVGARNTYITMHVLQATLAELVGRAGGRIVNLRGDGLIAVFGLVCLDHDKGPPSPHGMKRAMEDAGGAGLAMLEAVDKLINPALDGTGVPAGLQIGVAIDVGNVVVTRIGLDDAQEVTIYGDCVNNACHMRPSGYIMLSPAADAVYPESVQGRAWSVRDQDGVNLRLLVPDSLVVLQ